MTIRQFVVPSPAVATDWRWTVPGQYDVRLLAVTATLSARINPSTLADSSGNGWTLTTDGTVSYVTFGAAGPFAGGANNVAVSGTGQSGNVGIGQSASSLTWQIANPTFECWLNVGTDTSPFAYACVEIGTLGQLQQNELIYGKQSGDPTNLGMQILPSGFDFVPNALSRGVWHHIATKWDGANWVWYRDGVNMGNVSARPPSYAGSPRAQIGGYQTPNCVNGKQGPTAIYASALSDAQIAAHAAASASAAAYQAACLADSPKALWMFAELTNTIQRTASLRVTNGTATVALFPGFTATSGSGTFQWTWASNSPGNAQTVDQSVTQIVISDEILAPGYTVGTFTPDLGGTDQWSNIIVTADVFDSGAGGGGTGHVAAAPYLDAYLVPDFRKVT